MIQEKNCWETIIQSFPGFEPYWTEHLEFWGEEAPGLCNNLGAFAGYVFDLLKQPRKDTDKILMEIFNFAELCMLEGEFNVQNAVATCFLESVFNKIANNRPQLEDRFFGFLGPESLAYCEAWDDFTLGKTKSLFRKLKRRIKWATKRS